MDIKLIADILNAPIIIWLLSSVVIGLVTWAYKSSTEKRAEKRLKAALIDKAKEELYLLAEEAKLVASDTSTLCIKRIQYLIERTQYLPFDLAKDEYRPTIYNILLQFQAYTGDVKLKDTRRYILSLLRKLIKIRDRYQLQKLQATQPLQLIKSETDTINEAIKFYSEISKKFLHVMQR